MVQHVLITQLTLKMLIGYLDKYNLPHLIKVCCVTGDQQFLYCCPMKSADGESELNLFKSLNDYNEKIFDMMFLDEEEQYLAVARNLKQVQVYDVKTKSCSYVLAGHTDIVKCLDTCLSSSGRTLVVTGSRDNSVKLWDVGSRRCIGTGRGHMGAVRAVAFSKSWKNFFVSGSCDRTIKVWSLDGVSEDVDHETVLEAKAVVAAHDKGINSLAVSATHRRICSGSEDHTACIWKLKTRRNKRSLSDLVSVVVLEGHKRGVWSVEFAPVEKCVMTSSGDRTIKIWSISDGSCLKTFEGHMKGVLRTLFLARGTEFVSCDGVGLVKLWDVKTNVCIATYDPHEGKIRALAIGKKLLATGGNDAIVNLWHYCTATDKQEAFRKNDEAILRDLENAVLDANYSKAIRLAFKLRGPHKLYDLFLQFWMRSDAEDTIKEALSPLGLEEIRVLLEYVREWNTKVEFCHTAHFVLSHIFKIFPPSELMKIKGISDLLEGLRPHMQRHFSRLDRLERSLFLLDYTLNQMPVIDPEGVMLSPKDEPLLSESIGHGNEISSQALMEEKVSSKKRKRSK